MNELPFRPASPDDSPHPMPASVPPGMRLELSRAKVVPGRESEAEDWMRMLNDRHDEAVATLPAERAPFQASFLHREFDGSLWIYHLSLTAEERPDYEPHTTDIDRDHAAYGARVKLPGWEELRPMLLLTPTHIREAMQRWAQTGQE